MEREQFTFYRSFFAGIARIKSKTARCDAYDAIINYALNGMEPDIDSMPDAAASVYEMARPILDSSRKKAENGRRGGVSKPEANAKQTEANDKQTEANLKQVKEQEKEQVKDKEQMLYTPYSPPPGDDADEDHEDPLFAEFWAAYPKKVGKGAARKSFLKLPRKTQRLLLPALLAQKTSEQWTREGGRFIPNPATWINQCRWEDDPGDPAVPNTSNPFLRILMEEEGHG